MTTDYRRVLTEILVRRMGNDQIDQVFAGYTGYSPLGIVLGSDTPPPPKVPIFLDDFETGDFSQWS